MRTREAELRRASFGRAGSSLNPMPDVDTTDATADELRRAHFVDFFVARGIHDVPSASVIPVDPTLLFTVAGMVPFKGYFTGDETPPYKRAVSVQKCVRAGGKHNDLDDIGRTNRHFSFFEMLGNFSFGDYFKAEAIRFGVGVLHRGLGVDTERLWVTVHEDDDEAERIWRDDDRASRPSGSSASAKTTSGAWATPGRAARRRRSSGTSAPSTAQTAGRAPSSRPLHRDLEPRVHAVRPAGRRHARRRCRSRASTPAAGLERNLMITQGADSIWDIDVFRPLIARGRAGDRASPTAASPAVRATSRCGSSPSTRAR